MWNIGIIGAGAVGGYFIWGVYGSAHTAVTLLAEGERKARLEKGVCINGTVYTPDVKTPREKAGYDVILVATKYAGLSSAIEMLKEVSDENTIILSLLNGVDSEEKIKAAGVKGTILPSVMRIASRRTANEIVFDPQSTQGVFYGTSRAKTDVEKAAVQKLTEIFSDTRVNTNRKEDMELDIWFKYASNIANNLPQAVLGTDASLYTDSEHGFFLASRLWNEVRMVAAVRGIELDEEPFIFCNAPKTAKYSTLQDIENKRHTEIDMFAGHLMEMAEKAGIAVPYTEYTYHAIKALEEKNDGVIGK